MKIFYSWQSDLNPKYNRYFIKDCLEKAIKNINKNINLQEAVRLDHDTKDVPGSPDIVNTILTKIEESDVFVADISFIAKTKSDKHLPNPNVLIELGYALSNLTDNCLINIMNTSDESLYDKLPFDLAHKRGPITYNLSDKNTSEEKAKVKKNLVNDIEKAIKLIIPIRQRIDKPVSLREKPSIDNIKSHILASNPKTDWDHTNNGKQIAIYKNNVNLRIEINYNKEGIQRENFVAPWANKHPDKNATGYWCDIYFNLSHIYRMILVSVDGGRAMLPSPTEEDAKGDFLIVKPFDFKIAEIFQSSKELYDYMRRSGLKLKV